MVLLQQVISYLFHSHWNTCNDNTGQGSCTVKHQYIDFKWLLCSCWRNKNEVNGCIPMITSARQFENRRNKASERRRSRNKREERQKRDEMSDAKLKMYTCGELLLLILLIVGIILLVRYFNLVVYYVHSPHSISNASSDASAWMCTCRE